jgi:hypothetical protein
MNRLTRWLPRAPRCPRAGLRVRAGQWVGPVPHRAKPLMKPSRLRRCEKIGTQARMPVPRLRKSCVPRVARTFMSVFSSRQPIFSHLLSDYTRHYHDRPAAGLLERWIPDNPARSRPGTCSLSSNASSKHPNPRPSPWPRAPGDTSSIFFSPLFSMPSPSTIHDPRSTILYPGTRELPGRPGSRDAQTAPEPVIVVWCTLRLQELRQGSAIAVGPARGPGPGVKEGFAAPKIGGEGRDKRESVPKQRLGGSRSVNSFGHRTWQERRKAVATGPEGRVGFLLPGWPVKAALQSFAPRWVS